jgi:TPR repeat protein
MPQYAKVLRATLTALLILVSGAGAAVAGSWKDGNAAYNRGDYATALRLYRALADQGDSSGQNSLGFMYAMGNGVPQNHAEALKWYRLAADQGEPLAQDNSALGMKPAMAYRRTMAAHIFGTTCRLRRATKERVPIATDSHGS